MTTLAVGVLSTVLLALIQRETLRENLSDRLMETGHRVIYDWETAEERGEGEAVFNLHAEEMLEANTVLSGMKLVINDRVVLLLENSRSAHPSVTVSHHFLEPDRDVAAAGFTFNSALNQYVATIPFTSASGDHGIVVLTADADRVTGQLREGMMQILLVVIAICAILGLALHLLLSRTVTKPILDLARTAEAVAAGNLNARIGRLPTNEIGAAAGAVNEMADTLISQAESLRNSEQRHRAIFQSASDACFVIEVATGKTIAANQEASHLLGCPISDITGRTLRHHIPREDVRDLINLAKTLSNELEIRGFEDIHARHSDGRLIPVSINASHLTLGGQSLIIASVRDISQQRRQAEENRLQLRRVTALHAASRSCSTSLDTKTICQAIFRHVRAAMRCDAFHIDLWDEEHNVLTPEFSVDTIDGRVREITCLPSEFPIKEGPSRTVILERRPIQIFRDEREDGPVGLNPFGDKTRRSKSLLLVPMIAGDTVVGLLSSQSYQCQAYTQEDVDLLAAMANQAALAIHNARMHESTQRALATRESLNHIAKVMGATFDLRQISQSVYEEICHLLPCDSFFVSMIKPDESEDQTLFVVDTIDGKRIELPTDSVPRVPLDRKHTGHIFRTRRAILTLRQPDDGPPSDHLPFGDERRRSMSLMFVPLITRDRVVGVMSLQSYEMNAYVTQDLDLLQEIGDLTALALENARLYHDVATSESRHRAIVDSANVSVILTDHAGHILMWNRGAEHIFGHRAESVLGSHFSILFPGLEENLTRIKEAMSSGESWSAEMQAKHRNGSIHDLIFSVAGYTDADNEAAGHVIIASDLTDKKTLERALLQAQKMESIGTLAGGIAHDFNNLLTAIMGYTSYLQTLASPDSRMAHDLQQIEKAAQRASDLTGQLLAFSRKQLIRHQPLNLNDVVNETASLMRRTIGKHIVIEVGTAPNLAKVEADPTQMQQVLMNLAINARDAMPRGGHLRLTTENCLIEADMLHQHPDLTPGPHVRVSVADTGTGISDSTIERIFDPFFTTKPVGEGTGLGLAMVYGIIRSHGGSIEVDSTPGVGTTFHMCIPACTATMVTDAEPNEEDTVRGGNETILLVDDETMILKLGASLLERYGYRVLTATSGQVALDLFRSHRDRIDLVVLDMIMPGMNGAELATRLSEISPGTRILLSSGYALDHGAEELLTNGTFLGFLAKPYRMSQLARKVRHALDAPSQSPLPT